MIILEDHELDFRIGVLVPTLPKAVCDNKLLVTKLIASDH